MSDYYDFFGDYDESNEDDALRDMADDPRAYSEFDDPCFDCNSDIPDHDAYDCPKKDK